MRQFIGHAHFVREDNTDHMSAPALELESEGIGTI